MRIESAAEALVNTLAKKLIDNHLPLPEDNELRTLFIDLTEKISHKKLQEYLINNISSSIDQLKETFNKNNNEKNAFLVQRVFSLDELQTFAYGLSPGVNKYSVYITQVYHQATTTAQPLSPTILQPTLRRLFQSIPITSNSFQQTAMMEFQLSYIYEYLYFVVSQPQFSTEIVQSKIISSLFENAPQQLMGLLLQYLSLLRRHGSHATRWLLPKVFSCFIFLLPSATSTDLLQTIADGTFNTVIPPSISWFVHLIDMLDSSTVSSYAFDFAQLFLDMLTLWSHYLYVPVVHTALPQKTGAYAPPQMYTLLSPVDFAFHRDLFELYHSPQPFLSVIPYFLYILDQCTQKHLFPNIFVNPQQSMTFCYILNLFYYLAPALKAFTPFLSQKNNKHENAILSKHITVTSPMVKEVQSQQLILLKKSIIVLGKQLQASTNEHLGLLLTQEFTLLCTRYIKHLKRVQSKNNKIMKKLKNESQLPDIKLEPGTEALKTSNNIENNIVTLTTIPVIVTAKDIFMSTDLHNSSHHTIITSPLHRLIVLFLRRYQRLLRVTVHEDESGQGQYHDSVDGTVQFEGEEQGQIVQETTPLDNLLAEADRETALSKRGKLLASKKELTYEEKKSKRQYNNFANLLSLDSQDSHGLNSLVTQLLVDKYDYETGTAHKTSEDQTAGRQRLEDAVTLAASALEQDTNIDNDDYANFTNDELFRIEGGTDDIQELLENDQSESDDDKKDPSLLLQAKTSNTESTEDSLEDASYLTRLIADSAHAFETTDSRDEFGDFDINEFGDEDDETDDEDDDDDDDNDNDDANNGEIDLSTIENIGKDIEDDLNNQEEDEDDYDDEDDDDGDDSSEEDEEDTNKTTN